MKVCILTSVHDCRDPRIFYKEAMSLARAGYNVSLLASNCETHERNGIKIIGVGYWRSRWIRIVKIVPLILWKSIQIKADIYHIHDPELLIIVPILKLLGARVIYDVHEDFARDIRYKTYILSGLRYPLSIILRTIERVLSKLCYKVIAERYYKEIYPDAIEVLNYSVLNRISSGRSNYDRLDLDNSYCWYLYTGNITEDRGALTSLRLLQLNSRSGVAYIGKCHSDVARKIRRYAEENNINENRIKIIGEDQYLDSEEITWHGMTGRWVAGIALFPALDYLKRKELTKFYEYMELGLPILANNFPVWRKLIEGNRAGYVVNLDDSDEIRRIMKVLEADYEEKGRRTDLTELVREKFCWSKQERNLLSLYNGIF